MGPRRKRIRQNNTKHSARGSNYADSSEEESIATIIDNTNDGNDVTYDTFNRSDEEEEIIVEEEKEDIEAGFDPLASDSSSDEEEEEQKEEEEEEEEDDDDDDDDADEEPLDPTLLINPNYGDNDFNNDYETRVHDLHEDGDQILQEKNKNYKDFNISQYSNNEIAEMDLYNRPFDDDDPLTKTADLWCMPGFGMEEEEEDNCNNEEEDLMTKGQFARRLQSYYNQHAASITAEMREELDELLVDAFGDCANLPYKESVRKRKDGSRKKWLETEKYAEPEPTILEFPCCPDGHMVFVGKENENKQQCDVCKKFRSPLHKINYRCLIPIFRRLLQFPKFVEAVQFVHDDCGKDYYADHLDGAAVKKEMQSMDNMFNLFWKNKKPGLIHLPILLSIGWDGLQAFSTKTSPFWPTFVTIENLPPTFRERIGVGTFLTSIFTKTVDSEAENFIFSKCLIPELIALFNGIEIQVNNCTYIVQARVFSYMLDTPAYAKLFKMKYTGSLLCPCCRMPAERINQLTVTAYNYHGIFLPDNNFIKVVDGNRDPNVSSNLVNSTILRTEEEIALLSLQALKKYFNNVTAKHDPTHSYRKYTRVNQEQYLLDALAATQIRKNKKKKPKKDEICVNGVRSLSSFVSISYFEISTHTSADPMHAFYNCIKHKLRLLAGKRGNGEKLLSYCAATKIHPSLKQTVKDKKGNKKWDAIWSIATESERDKVTTWVNCLLAPLGHKNRFQVKDVFKKDGFLRCTAAVDLLCNLMDFLLYAVPAYNEEYRLFFHLYSLCCSRVLGTKIKKSTHNELCAIMIEIAAIHDEMFPPTESTITMHQSLEIVHHIAQAGPARCFQTSGNERALKALKAFLPTGGMHIDLVSFRRYIKFETEQIYGYYSDNSKKTKKLMPEDNFYYRDDDESWKKVLCFTDEPFRLFQSAKIRGNILRFTKEETAYMFYAIQNHVLDKTLGDVKKALQWSPLFRILQCFEHRAVYDSSGNKVKNPSKKLKEMSLNEWMKSVLNKYDQQDGAVYFTTAEIGEQYKFAVGINPSNDPLIKTRIVEERLIYTADIEIMRMMSVNATFPISVNVYDKANVFGTAFRSRGIDKRETSVEIKTATYGGDEKIITRTNNANILQANWSKPEEYSTWSKYFIAGEIREGLGQTNYGYGQINAFLQIHVPFDPFINGLCLASITSRKHVQHNYVDHIIGNDDNQSLNDELFIPVTNIKSTPLLVAGFSILSTEAALKAKNSKYARPDIRSAIKKIKYMASLAKPLYAGAKFKEDIAFPNHVENELGPITVSMLSYLVMIEMQRTRYNAVYNPARDEQYRENFSDAWNHELYLNFNFSGNIHQ